jgi:hypothetical protein
MVLSILPKSLDPIVGGGVRTDCSLKVVKGQTLARYIVC